MRHNLFGNKIIQNCFKINHYPIDRLHIFQLDNDLLLRQETQKSLHVMEADLIPVKANIGLMSLAQRRHCACLSNKLFSY